MSAAGFVVSSLPAYVENNKDLLLKNFGLVGTDTRKRIGIQTGVKKSAYLNYLDINPTLQSGAAMGRSCGTPIASIHTFSPFFKEQE